MLLPHLLLLFIISKCHSLLNSPAEKNSTICEITVPIATWLKNNTGPCTVVKGHFILNEVANKYTREIFGAFPSLKRIEGCIYVRKYTASKNLSFFSNLEEVICSKKNAKLSQLTNVIDVIGPELKTMGFNSLTTVDGPGQIVLSYEESYHDRRDKDGEQCFSKKEQTYLAYHPQFRRTMYHTCEVDDPCFRLDYYKQWYTVWDIPKNCTVFVGFICLWGPFELEMVADRFQNLTLLIGQLHVMGTLFNRLDIIFPKLENIYPFEHPHRDVNFYMSCSEIANTAFVDATQVVHAHLNRFLTDISLPSLQPIRPLDISRSEESAHRFRGITSFNLDDLSFLPDTITDQCVFFPNFTCGNYVNAEIIEDDFENRTWIEETWIISMLAVAIGVAFSIRSIVLLQFSHASKGLPYTRSLIIIVIFISTLVALESCVFYQRTYTVSTGSINGYYYFPELKSTFFIYPPIQWAMSYLVACKHACLAIIILSYIDIIIFYRTGSYSISSKYCVIVFLLAIMLSFSLNSQLSTAIRGRRPNYAKDKDIVFFPIIMNIEYVENFTKLVPEELYLRYYNGILRLYATESLGFNLDQLPLENFGQSLSAYSNICDILVVAVVVLFYLLTRKHVIVPRHNYTILIALYLQLSVNRIRHSGCGIYGQSTVGNFGEDLGEITLFFLSNCFFLLLFICQVPSLFWGCSLLSGDPKTEDGKYYTDPSFKLSN